MNKNKLTVLVSGIVVILLMVIGISFAIFRFGEESTNQELVLGDIWMKYTESNGISLENSLPGDEYTNYFEFTITGTNTYTKKDIWYDISLTHGDTPAGKTEENRIADKYLKFKLTEVVGNTETEIFTDKTYDDLTSKRVHVDTISKSTNEYSKTYRLYMVISEELTYGNSSDAILTTEEFGKIFGSVKVNVTGDFNEKEIQMDLNAAGTIKTNIVPYSVSSASDFTGGLVGINTNGTLYNETTSEEVREYRYIGSDVENYAYFNCKDTDGTYNYGDESYDYQNNCEIWRIIGLLKNSNNQLNLKLVRNNPLEAEEMPDSYVINGTTYYIGTFSPDSQPDFDNPLAKDYVYFNFPDTLRSTNANDWTTSGLQYFLNTESDSNGTLGYYSTITSNTRTLIDTNYTYYLGNVDENANNLYNQERGNIECDSDITYDTYGNNCNIWNGNKATWNGAIGLLYPSDFWYVSFENNYQTWMNTIMDFPRIWFISPSSNSNNLQLALYDVITSVSIDDPKKVNPVVNLKSNVKILTGDGTVDLPYVFIG